MSAQARSISTSNVGRAGLGPIAAAGRAARGIRDGAGAARRAAAYFRDDWAKLVALLCLMVASIAVSLLSVWPVAVLVDLLSSGPRHPDWIHRLFLAPLPASLPGRAFGLAVIALALRLAQELMQTGRALLGFRIGVGGLMRVRCDLYRKLQALCIGYHRAQPQGDALYRLNQDAAGFQVLFNVGVSVAASALSLGVMVAIMLSRNARLTGLALAVVPPLVWVNLRFGGALRRRCAEAKEVEQELTTVVQRSMASIGLIQAFGREEEAAARFHATLRSSARAWVVLHGDEVRHALAVGAIFGVGSALVFGYGGYLAIGARAGRAAGGMSLGDLTAFLMYLAMLYDPLCKLSGAGASAQAGLAGAERVFDVLDRDPVVRDRPEATPLPRAPRTLTLEGIGFAYHPGHPVLHDVEATIRPGEMVAFVGSSGVGKSTLLHLLPRFADPTRGALRLDGRNARSVRVADLRRHVALVLQEGVLMPATIAENIAYGRPDAPFADIRRAAALAGAARFIEALPRGYDTPLDDAGQRLSRGQRQGIAIARALLTEAPILVLDEPTSALDPEHARAVVETLRSLRGRRTIVLVSHRIDAVIDCDRIYVLQGGRVVERGAHAELLARRGRYFALAQAPAPARSAL